MPDSFTSNLNLTKPEVGGSTDTWGIKLNGNMDGLDGLFDAGPALKLAHGGTGAVTAADARTNLGLGALATQNTITASQVSDFESATSTVAATVVASTPPASHTHGISDVTGLAEALASAAGGGGLVNGGTFTATGTAIDFNSLPASIKKLHLVFSGLETNGSSSIICQLGTSAAFKTSNYKGGLVIAGSSSSSALITNGLGVDVSNSSTAISHGAIDIFRQDANKFTSRSVCSRSAPNAFGSFGGSSVDLIDELTRLRFTTANGTDSFTAGNITILWEI